MNPATELHSVKSAATADDNPYYTPRDRLRNEMYSPLTDDVDSDRYASRAAEPAETLESQLDRAETRRLRLEIDRFRLEESLGASTRRRRLLRQPHGFVGGGSGGVRLPVGDLGVAKPKTQVAGADISTPLRPTASQCPETRSSSSSTCSNSSAQISNVSQTSGCVCAQARISSWPRQTLPSNAAPIGIASTSEHRCAMYPSMSPRFHAANACRTTSVFACDIARPVSRLGSTCTARNVTRRQGDRPDAAKRRACVCVWPRRGPTFPLRALAASTLHPDRPHE